MTITQQSRRYAVAFDPTHRAFVISDADLGQPVALDGETLTFRTMLAGRQWLDGCALAGLSEKASRHGAQSRMSAARTMARRFVATCTPLANYSFEYVACGA